MAVSGEAAVEAETSKTEAGSDGNEKEQAPAWLRTRRAIAVPLLLAWVVVIWVSYETPHLHVCDDLVARVGTAPLVHSCRPLSVTDPPMLAILVVAGLLLLSTDLPVLEIPGVLRLERQLKEQVKRQEDIVAMIHKLEISQRQVINLTVNEANRAAENAATLGELAAQLAAKGDRFDSDAS